MLTISPAAAETLADADLTALRESYDHARRDDKTAKGWALAEAYRLRGKNRSALSVLLALDANQKNATTSAKNRLRLAAVYLGMGQYRNAEQTLTQVQSQLALLTPLEQIAFHLERGKLQVERGTLADATAEFEQAHSLAVQYQLPIEQARALLNGLRARLDAKDIAEFSETLDKIAAVLRTVPLHAERRMLQLSLADSYRRGITEFGFPPELAATALALIDEVIKNSNSARELGYAFGFKGHLYEDFGQLEAALSLTRKAIFYASAERALEQLYRWEWQAGRILRAQGDLAGAQDFYQRAVRELNLVKPNFALGSRRTFNQLVAPVYTEYADVLLQRTSVISAAQDKQSHLASIRDLLETLKAAEVEDYFANECVARVRALDAASVGQEGAAIIYPVFLDDRTEILVEVNGDLAQFTTGVGRNQVTATIRRLRLNLERSSAGQSFLAPAQQLHAWLIDPVESFLEDQSVHTLVIVPEGALRTIPVAALHNGERFLVQDYAIATTPGIQLTKQLPVLPEENMLVGGLTEGVQGFVELPNVAREINTVSAIYPARTIQDATFQLHTVEDALATGGFSVAHFATHGEFNSDHAKSFILTYDDKLTLDGLQQVLSRRDQSEPLDLLVLSACKTAAGDDRAALGLAGVAVQSGAQSALASLWYISDAATAELIEGFYTALQFDNSKAQSLRIAQLELLSNQQYAHPSYWAPYLLVGNWL